MHYTFLIILVWVLVVGFGYLILKTIDKRNYNKKLNDCEAFIPFNSIPQLSRVIHCCTNLNNIYYGAGDLIELDLGDKKEYYICRNFGVDKLTIAQVKRLETIYNIKIL